MCSALNSCTMHFYMDLIQLQTKQFIQIVFLFFYYFQLHWKHPYSVCSHLSQKKIKPWIDLQTASRNRLKLHFLFRALILLFQLRLLSVRPYRYVLNDGLHMPSLLYDTCRLKLQMKFNWKFLPLHQMQPALNCVYIECESSLLWLDGCFFTRTEITNT